MAYSDFDKLKAFFFELKNAKFHPEKMRSRFAMNGGWATVNKAECFDLLRKKIPDLQGKDDAFLIKYLSNPNNIKNRVLAGFVAGERIELEKSLAETAVTTEEFNKPLTGQETQPAGEVGSSGEGMPGIPSGPSFTSTPRAPRIVIRNAPQAPKPDIAIANSSGHVTEAGNPSKLVTARSDGSIIKPTSANPTIHIADKSGNIVKTYNIKSPGWLKNFGSNVGSKINIGLNKGLNKAISGINNFSLGGGSGGGSRSVFSRLGRFGKGGTTGGGSLTSKAKGRGGLIFAGSIIAMMLLTGVLTITGTTPTGEAAPISPGIGSDLDNKYNFAVFNIFDGNAVDDSLLKKYIDRAFATGKVKSDEQKNLLPSRAKFIRDQAQIAGLNPAIFLGYWESETAFSDYTYPGVRPGSDLGCDPTNPALKTFDDSVLCAVGKSQISNSRTSQCAISKDINSPACQAIAFQQAEGVKLPISTLKDFLNSYGSKVADPNNIKSDNIVKQTIVDLGLVPYTTTSPSQKEFTLSCPIANENNTCSHFDDPRDPCHCNPSQYLSMAACQADASLNYGIDVGTKASKTALIPYITYQGETTPQSITCQLITAQSPTQPNPQSGGELQQILHYHCSTGKTGLYLQYNHIKASSSFPSTVSSGQIVGDIANYGEGFRRLNIQVGVNGECAYNQTQFCKRGGDYFQCPLQKESPPDY